MHKKVNELVFLRPWAMKQDTLIAMTEIVERHLNGVKLSQDEIAAKIGADKNEPPAYEVINGVANIPIFGVIAKRAGMVGSISQPRGTSVEQIQNDFLAALEDPKVNSILLNIDSPGGSVAGILELSDLIYQARGQKPVVAFANGQMDSAAYWLGSSAEKIFTTKSSEVGSIGVYTVISDYSILYHNEGIKKQVIKAGKFKAAGDPSKPLTEEEKNLIQEEVNSYYDLFVEAIARNRGLAMDNVLKVADGRVFIGQKAVDAGLADGIRTFEDLLGRGSSAAGGRGTKTKVIASSDGVQIETQGNLDKNHKQEEEKMQLTIEKVKAEHAAVADALLQEGKAAGIEEGKVIGIEEGKKIGIEEAKKAAAAEAVAAEKVRCSAILESMPPGARSIAATAIKEGLSVEASKAKFLDAINAGTIKSIGDGGGEEALNAAEAAAGSDPTGKKHLERAEKYAKENNCDVVTALKATAKPNKQ